MCRKIDNRSGFTILELLVAIGIFVVILMAMASFSTLLIRTNGADEVRNAAVRLALEKIHQAELLPFDTNPSNSSGFLQVRDSSSDIAYTVSFSTSSASNIKKIDETMNYNYRGKPLSFTLSTIVVK